MLHPYHTQETKMDYTKSSAFSMPEASQKGYERSYAHCSRARPL